MFNTLNHKTYLALIGLSIAILSVAPAFGAADTSDSENLDSGSHLAHFMSPKWMDPVDFDADGVVDEIIALPSDFDYTTSIYKVAIASNESQLIALLDATLRHTYRSRAINAFRGFFARLVNLYPRSAYAYIQSRNPHNSDWNKRALFRIWTLNDAEDAVTFAETLDGSERTQAGVNIITSRHGLSQDRIQEVAESLGFPVKFPNFSAPTTADNEKPDPEVAFQKLVEDYTSSPSNLIHQVTRGWAATDPEAAWNSVQNFVELPELKQELGLIIHSSWVNLDPKASLELLLGFDHYEVVGQLVETLERIVRTDPEYALEMTERLSGHSGAVRAVLTQKVLEAVIQVDLDIALKFIEGLDELQVVESTHIAIAMQHALSSPWRAMELLQALESSGDSLNAMERVCQLWSIDDLSGSLAWLETVTDDRVYFTCAEVILQTSSARNPIEALDAVLFTKDATRRETLFAMLFQQVAQVDPVNALELAGRARSHGQGADIQPLMDGLMDVGRHHEAINLIEYVPENDRNSFVRSFFRNLVNYDVNPLDFLRDVDDEYFLIAAVALLEDYRFAHSHAQESIGSCIRSG